MAGRRRLDPEQKKQRVVVYLSPGHIARLQQLGEGDVMAGLRKLVEVGVVPASVIPKPSEAATVGSVGISPYSGKPLCADCRRKGANVHCLRCGANAKGKSQ
jgi:hypothetical protein